MVDITHKNSTLRKAIAQALVQLANPLAAEAIIKNTVPKGNVSEMSKTAGLFAVKRTSDVIPDCHPLPVEYSKIWFDQDGLTIKIFVEVHTIYKTGVEVEAMHGASVVALTIYDMLKPIDKDIEIKSIKLLEKSGGKSDSSSLRNLGLKTGVIVCSDSISAGKKEDKAGLAIISKLESCSIKVENYSIIPDEEKVIQQKLDELLTEDYEMIIFTGGTGLSVRDVTPEALRPRFDYEIPGIMEAARSYGQSRTPYAMLSRGIAGMIGNCLILTLPGSTNGAVESMDALFPQILHIFEVRREIASHKSRE